MSAKPVPPLPVELRARMERTCRDALGRYGATSQMNVLVEECAELIVSISHMRRKRATLEQVASEIADVIIMSEQARQLMSGLVEAHIIAKLDRLAKRLEAE